MRCQSGKDHDAIKRDPARWRLLAYVGRQETPADDYGPHEILELRNCACGSTLCLDITATATRS